MDQDSSSEEDKMYLPTIAQVYRLERFQIEIVLRLWFGPQQKLDLREYTDEQVRDHLMTLIREQNFDIDKPIVSESESSVEMIRASQKKDLEEYQA